MLVVSGTGIDILVSKSIVNTPFTIFPPQRVGSLGMDDEYPPGPELHAYFAPRCENIRPSQRYAA